MLQGEEGLWFAGAPSPLREAFTRVPQATRAARTPPPLLNPSELLCFVTLHLNTCFSLPLGFVVLLFNSGLNLSTLVRLHFCCAIGFFSLLCSMAAGKAAVAWISYWRPAGKAELQQVERGVGYMQKEKKTLDGDSLISCYSNQSLDFQDCGNHLFCVFFFFFSIWVRRLHIGKRKGIIGQWWSLDAVVPIPKRLYVV